MRSSASSSVRSMSTSIERRASRSPAMTTSAATNSAATASAPGVPAATKIIPISTATEPARSDAKCSAFAANAGELKRRAARRLASAREASKAITNASTTKAHQAASTPCTSPLIRRRSDSAAIATDTMIRNALSPSAARCSALPWPYW